MKRLFILIAIFCSVLSAKAQFGVGGGGSTVVGRISGTLIDSLTKKPVDYASVGIFRSTGKSPINGVLTDEKGNFKIDNVHPGSYRLEITFIGYPTKVVNAVVTTPSKPDKNLGIVIISSSTKALKEVVVEGSAPLIDNRIDKIVYNAEKDLTAAGGNATDILEKVPLVSVDINGNVALRGDANVRVLINGKPSGATSANLSDVLKSIPADQIKSVEVITSPSAKYDAEGTAGIINIVTKQKNISGLSGSVSGGVGTRQNNGNINLNYNKNRFSLTANIGGNLTWPQTSLSDFKQVFHDTTSETKGTNEIKRYGAIGSLTAGYEFNDYNSINSTLRLNQGDFNTDANTVTNALNPYSSSAIGHNSFGGFDWNIDYTHKFKKEGEELDLSTQWSHSSVVTDYTTYYSAIYSNLANNINGANNEYTLQADYTLPISKVLKLEAGGKTILRRINSTSDLFNVDPSTSQFVFDNVNSSRYNYNQDVLAGYSVFTITLPKAYSVLAGVRVENTDIHGDPINAAQTNLTPFSQDYTTLVPSLTIQKQLTPTQTIKLAYSKRITRPSLQYLNPFINKNNIQSQSVGNPDLDPEISQTVELDYNTFIKSSVINLSAYYKHTAGLIEGIATPIDVDVSSAITEKGTLTSYQNIGNNNSLGGSFFGSVTPFKILTIMGSINAYTYKPDPAGIYNLDQSQNGTYVQYSAFLRGSLTLPSGFLAESFAIENSPHRTIQGTNPSFSMFGVGVRKQFLQKKASIGLNAIQPFNTYKDFNSNISSPGFTQTSKFQYPFRSFGITFSYSFGKLSFSNPQQKKKGVNNDDLKQGDQGMGGGAAPGGGQ
jgi:outer membrane receptor protein involved in Fe transport